jgi:ubiquinone/menaquinone biosynthesis C-methylase UbiE
MNEVTDRQRREVEYHKSYAASLPNKPINFDVIASSSHRWWNGYWSMWRTLRSMPLHNMRVLVVGCGAGMDAVYFAKLGANVSGFDISPNMLERAKQRAESSGVTVAFERMAAEQLTYPADTFDLVLAHDILHHVEIGPAMDEIVRVCKPGATFVMNEIYSHSVTDVIRHSSIVERVLYPRMTRFIYKDADPYITTDERKLSERDVAKVTARLSRIRDRQYYNMIVTRLVPDKFRILNKLDRIGLMLLGPFGNIVAGRVVLVGTIGTKSRS